MIGGDSMKKLFDELNEVLLEELNVYKEMLEVTNKKTEVITAGHVKDLDKITQLENTIIINIGKLEDKREKVVENIRKQLGLQEELNMTNIMEHLDKQAANDIEIIKSQLLDTLNKLKEKNQLNNVLIQDSLEFINLNIELLTSTSEQGTYNNKTGKEKSSQNVSFFDAKA